MILRTLTLAAALLLSLSTEAAETIESFHADIEVRRNGDLYVTETIVVQAEGKAIKRGIYRDFPTRYENARGRDLVVGFEVLGVKRDDAPEPFHIEDRSNGKRVYIGNRNVFLEPGIYEYQLGYLTTRQLGFFDGFDELYWNVTGTGWNFPIGKASARVTLPAPVSDFQLTGYTGSQGSTQQNLNYRRISDAEVYFETSLPLARREGLTIVAGWPSGIIDVPSAAQRRAWFFEDNKPAVVVIGGAIILFIYYWLVWLRVGKDPESGVIVPHYQAPAGYSPASMRYIQNMDYDKKCFTAAIVNLAVEGAVEIENDDDSFYVSKTDNSGLKFAPGEHRILNALFADGRTRVSIEQSQHKMLAKAIRKHKGSLKTDYEKIYFNTNRGFLVPGVLLTFILAGFGISSLPSEEQIIKTIFIAVFTLVLLSGVFSATRGLRKGGKMAGIRLGANLFGILVFAGFILMLDFPVEEFTAGVAWPMISGIVVMLGINYGFHQWLKAPTLAGRRLLDRIDGFKHYLEVAEQDEIALQDAPTFTTDLYEAYLPFAIALDLENEWTAKLEHAIASGAVEPGYRHPGWYRTPGRHDGHFSKALSDSFNSAIASSSVAPGSSSGSSGGSSGGGGGGGGGGGW